MSRCYNSLQFLSCLQNALITYGLIELTLKTKQVICLESLFLKRDLLAVLPTGFGKSLIFQVLPALLQERDKSSSIVIVICPLSSIIKDQLSKCRKLGLKAAVLGVKKVEDEDGNISFQPEWQGSHSEIMAGKFEVLFCHPEAFLTAKEGLEVLQGEIYRSTVKAVVVDEAHCILEWGSDFRPDYSKLGVLAALFPNAQVAALTATATKHDREVIASSLCLHNPKVVIGNLDRKNIFYEKKFRDGHDEMESYVNILKPIAQGLLEKKLEFPLHVIYLSLPWCGRAYKLFESVLKENQYCPVGGSRVPENRLFAQFHSPQTDRMKDSLLKQLCSSKSKCRVVFATVAMGMGVDIPSLRNVIHIGPPSSVREYCQETGRAGRDGKPSRAVLYYNNRDLAANKPGMKDDIRVYCRSSDICLRKQLLCCLDAPTGGSSVALHSCCDVCLAKCQ